MDWGGGDCRFVKLYNRHQGIQNVQALCPGYCSLEHEARPIIIIGAWLDL